MLVETVLGRHTFVVGLLLKIGVVASCCIGIYLHIAVNGSDFMGSDSIFLYFTTQSNLWIAQICLVFLVADFFSGGRRKLPQWLYSLKFMFTISILLTFVVFFALLAPLMSASYLFSMGNLLLHLVTPMLALADFVLCDYGFGTSRRYILFGAVMPLLYMVEAYGLAILGVSYGGRNVPYYFMDYAKLGWLTIGDGSIGVAYWIAGITLILFAMSWGLLRLKNVRERRVGDR
ncbi:MAG: Pr6Pr family membrane protein [Saccharofermentanales bacterium]